MKYDFYKTSLALLITFSLVSCEDFFETTLELEVPEAESQLVLGAVLSSNSTTAAAALSETVSLQADPTIGFINDGEVNLQLPSGDSFMLNATGQEGAYSSTMPVAYETGSYTITADAPDGRSVTATAALPSKPLISEATATFNENPNSDRFNWIAVDIIIQDEPSSSNFYKVDLCIKLRDAGQHCPYIESDDPNVFQSSDYPSMLLSDATFEDESYRLRVYFSKYFDQERLQYVKVNVAGISEDHYRYDRYLTAQQENEDNPFTSPVQLHTNIEGGQGLFAIEHVNTYEIEF